MTNEEAKSCIQTIEMLRKWKLKNNQLGVMNVIDADNCEKIIKVLHDIPKYKDAYGKGWDDGAKATYEHLKMCEEEQSGDLISRDAVLDIMEKEGHKWGNDYRDWVDAIEEIKNLPSVNPQESKWISVSEKLPDIHNRSENYLVTLKRGGVHTALFTECDGKHWWTYDDVVAWMPLPPCYKPQESEDNE